MNRILENAPASGFVIACLKDRLVFAPYKICNGVFTAEGWDCPDFAEAEECHFFDDSREYRRIYRSARRDVIETVLTAQEEQAMDPDLIFVEEVLVKPQYAQTGKIPSTLTIVNRYRYSEYDTIVLEDYRISCSGLVSGTEY